jgi:type IV pilus assembly protein PilB
MTEKSRDNLLAKALLEKKILSASQLEEVREICERTGHSVAEVILDLGYAKEEVLLAIIGDEAKAEIVDLDKREISPELLERVPPSIAKIYNLIPLKSENDTLTVAVSEPLSFSALEELRFALGVNIKEALCTRGQLQKALEKYYAAKKESLKEILLQANQGVAKSAAKVEELGLDKLKELAGQAPVIKLINQVILEAVERKASDIHLEPFEEEYRIRYRIDGECYEVVRPPKTLSLALASRIKVLANLDVAETRLPQDGRILLNIGEKKIDLRVSCLPTVFGESVVMRVLDKSTVNLSLEQIGLGDALKEKIRSLINRPNGIILVTGPTGSGKTTTLYSCLREINKIDYKIITTEDPVEYDIPGIIQVSIRPKINLSFALSLRHILRQDPDIIMVGEIRDSETAEIAIQAALTGHLVFSTLHTNDAPGAITRLFDMGVEPFLITSTLQAALAQRLVRLICPQCKEKYSPKESELALIGLSTQEAAQYTFYRGKGCENCHQSGYRGRSGIFELFLLSDEIRALIIEQKPSAVLREAARKQGMRTLREDGLEKIFSGLTTIEEVARQTQWFV